MREDWIECTFADVIDIISGKNQKNVVDRNGKYPIYGSGGIMGRANDYLCESGTTIIGRKGTINSPIYVKERFWNVDTAFGFYPFSILNNRLLYFFCIYFNFKALDKSTTIPSLAKRDLLQIAFPLPPIPIQKAIVNKIEELFSSLDSGIADLKKAQDQLVIYRQAVLKKAFEGECFVDAKKHKLKNITSKIGSGSTPKGGQANYKESGIPLVRSLNVHFDYIKYEGLAFIDENQAEKLKNVIIQEGDVLLNITGASIGRVNIAPKEFENGRVNQHVSIIRPKNNIFNTKFLKLYLQSSKVQNWIDNVNVGATRQGLTKSALENLEIPVPSLKEQHQIVREIESRLSVCDKVEESLTESLEKSQALRQSILKKAFEGKLLSEEEIANCKASPDYEPASVLLAKIKAEKKKK
ncbi:restriction endonuclease subunit S [Gelidibacter sp. F63206]|uniref:restriction endonuclease subunit S n=1 Tax=Gelidibacter sp. F63206 TaxID=2926425 RepID=UPI001FF626B6|nr:restriction endonuclease subunit S [Gelidibacter sp. F63206]MCK0115347.1 restriction endonuclease subunit S [Gelidibacter sp. F63206]